MHARGKAYQACEPTSGDTRTHVRILERSQSEGSCACNLLYWMFHLYIVPLSMGAEPLRNTTFIHTSLRALLATLLRDFHASSSPSSSTESPLSSRDELSLFTSKYLVFRKPIWKYIMHFPMTSFCDCYPRGLLLLFHSPPQYIILRVFPTHGISLLCLETGRHGAKCAEHVI